MPEGINASVEVIDVYVRGVFFEKKVKGNVSPPCIRLGIRVSRQAVFCEKELEESGELPFPAGVTQRRRKPAFIESHYLPVVSAGRLRQIIASLATGIRKMAAIRPILYGG